MWRLCLQCFLSHTLDGAATNAELFNNQAALMAVIGQHQASARQAFKQVVDVQKKASRATYSGPLHGV